MKAGHRVMGEMKSDGCSDILPIGVSVVIALIVGVLHYAIFRLTFRFVEIYEGAGAELPLITRFLTDSPLFYWITPIVVSVSFILHQSGKLSAASVLIISVLGTVVSTVICVAGLYLPIFHLGSVVVQ